MDRRQFISTAAAGLGARLVSAAQTRRRRCLHGSCEDYRAAAGIDLAHDEADHQAGRTIAAPALIMWGRRSHTGRFYGGDLVSTWREAARDVTGGPLDTGHYLEKEAPQALIDAFGRHFA